MSCKYLYKSGAKKGKYCSVKLTSKRSKYCKIHKSVVKAQQTRERNKKNKNKPPPRSKTPPPKKSRSTGSGPPSFLSGLSGGNPISNLSNLLSLFDIPILEIPISNEQEEEKKEEIVDKDGNIIHPTEINIDVDSNHLQNIKGLLSIIKLYKDRPTKEESTINYDLERLCRIEKDLTNLDNMIGIHQIKDKICDMIIYLCQKHNGTSASNLNLPDELKNNEYLHTVLQGPPGCGKTSLARILAKMYTKLGFLKTGKLVFAKRSDLVGKYCGHTAYLTQQKIDEAKGGVLFIDEAYSLGNKEENPDAFSRECIDTLNQNLSERDDFVCIIAGYKDQLEKRFFAVNPGLARRFPWTFSIEGYSSKELEEMFVSKLDEVGFRLNENALDTKFFNLYKDNFPFFGGSILTFINKIKICNYKRLFGRLEKENIVTRTDIENAFEMYKLVEMGSQLLEKGKPPFGMYM